MDLSLDFLFCSIVLHFCLCVVPYSLMTVALKYIVEIGRLIPPVPFFLNVAFASQGLLCFHTNCEIICSSLMKILLVV